VLRDRNTVPHVLLYEIESNMAHMLHSTCVPYVSHHGSLSQVLAEQAARIPDAPALLAPDRAPLTYSRLSRHIDDVVQTLHAMGLGRNDRIALVLPNGPEMAVASFAVAAGATCVPLNPAYSAHEFATYLAHLHPKMLIVQEGLDSPVRAVAQACGLHIIELVPMLDAEAGLFALIGVEQIQATHHELALPDDTALVLVTSGTTSRPKIVPLTHTNICTAAHDMGIALELVQHDRLLSIMPLFHSHGLISTVLTSLIAGASVVCPPSFSASTFFDCMAIFGPTWYSAVPTIHHLILQYATLHHETVTHASLRFIRSSSASLPPWMLTELERVFNAPVIEAYGTTEVSSITCNPLPPRQRKTGSVGIATGPEVAIMDEAGTLLPAGSIGEIVVRGASVIRGYDDATADRDAFTHGWFRTGDQGLLDTDGYLFITGRLKEIINRGGEKIAPQEVDAVLLDHPAVAQAATFAVPHVRWGEDVATAVVLRQNTSATEQELRQFVATRLATFKVPSQVLIVEDIPKGPTGKLQRIGLAERLGLTALDEARPPLEGLFVAPRTSLEAFLVEVWQEVLGRDHVGVYDNFFDLGGDSLLSLQIIARVEKRLGLRISPGDLMFQTLGQLASACEARMSPSRSLEARCLSQRLLHALKSVVSRRHK
jgi:acyl-CoA synthetase (AMP-forming)/AMP-acid ligase II/acyl carrier protein